MRLKVYYRLKGGTDNLELFPSLEALQATLKLHPSRSELEYINACNEDEEIMFTGVEEILNAR